MPHVILEVAMESNHTTKTIIPSSKSIPPYIQTNRNAYPRYKNLNGHKQISMIIVEHLDLRAPFQFIKEPLLCIETVENRFGDIKCVGIGGIILLRCIAFP